MSVIYMLESMRCVVLNTTYRPVQVVSAKRALKMIFEGKVHVVENHPTYVVHSVRETWPVPTMVALLTYIKERVGPAILTKRNLFIRDKNTCQYCRRHKADLIAHEFLTVDHVLPRSHGGRSIWTNVITACSTCNNKKGNTLLSECRMSLPTLPTTPTIFEIWSRYLTQRYHL